MERSHKKVRIRTCCEDLWAKMIAMADFIC